MSDNRLKNVYEMPPLTFFLSSHALFLNQFHRLALTSPSPSFDEAELYNPPAGVKGQQERGREGKENHSLDTGEILTSNFRLDLSASS